MIRSRVLELILNLPDRAGLKCRLANNQGRSAGHLNRREPLSQSQRILLKTRG
jgi:hypothetical protein